MLRFQLAHPDCTRIATLVLVATFVVHLGAGCSTNSEALTATQKCAYDELYDSRKHSCIRPQSQEEARQVATRTDLEVLRDSGDPLTLVEVYFIAPIDRSTFGPVLSTIQPSEVQAISFYFPKIDGGYQAQARTDGSVPSLEQLLDQARLVITTRYASLGESDESAFAASFDEAFKDTEEQYSAVRLFALPSRLIATWDANPNISYIAVQRGKP